MTYRATHHDITQEFKSSLRISTKSAAVKRERDDFLVALCGPAEYEPSEKQAHFIADALTVLTSSLFKQMYWATNNYGTVYWHIECRTRATLGKMPEKKEFSAPTQPEVLSLAADFIRREVSR